MISSSRIRFLLGVGQVDEAAILLGRNYKIQGMVEVGDQRGRTLGFPTANLVVWDERIIPLQAFMHVELRYEEKSGGQSRTLVFGPHLKTAPSS